jgi:hypothetical protein
MPSSVDNMPRAPDPIGIREKYSYGIIELTYFLGVLIGYNDFDSFQDVFPK